MGIRSRGFGITHPGYRRSENQDDCLILEAKSPDEPSLYVVCDGIAGEKGGAIAAQTVIELLASNMTEFCDHLKLIGAELSSDGVLAWSLFKNAPRMWLVKKIEEANTRIRWLAENDPGLSGMGTTVAAVLVWEDRAHVAWVGDTRVYHVSPSGEFWHTEDHTDDSGALQQDLGASETVDVSVEERTLAEGDRLVLCSDGLYKVFSPGKLEVLILDKARQRTPKKMCMALFEHSARESDDNITVITVYLDGGK